MGSIHYSYLEIHKVLYVQVKDDKSTHIHAHGTTTAGKNNLLQCMMGTENVNNQCHAKLPSTTVLLTGLKFTPSSHAPLRA